MAANTSALQALVEKSKDLSRERQKEQYHQLPGGGRVALSRLAAASQVGRRYLSMMSADLYVAALEEGGGEISGTAYGRKDIEFLALNALDSAAENLKKALKSMPDAKVRAQLHTVPNMRQGDCVPDFFSNDFMEGLNGVHIGLHQPLILSVLLSSVPAALSQAWTTHRQDKRHSLSEGHYRSEVVPWLMAQHEWAESTWHGRIPAFADRSVELAECLYFLYTIDPNLADRKRLRLEKQFSIRSPIPHSLMLKITGDGFQVETWKNWDQRWAAHEGRRDELDPSFERNHRNSAIMRLCSMPRQVIDLFWSRVGDAGLDVLLQWSEIRSEVQAALKDIVGPRSISLKPSPATHWKLAISENAGRNRPANRHLQVQSVVEALDNAPAEATPSNPSEGETEVELMYQQASRRGSKDGRAPKERPDGWIDSKDRKPFVKWTLPTRASDFRDDSGNPIVGRGVWSSDESAMKAAYGPNGFARDRKCTEIFCTDKECVAEASVIANASGDIELTGLWMFNHNKAGCPRMLAGGLKVQSDPAIRNAAMASEFVRRFCKPLCQHQPFGLGSELNDPAVKFSTLRPLQKEYLKRHLPART